MKFIRENSSIVVSLIIGLIFSWVFVQMISHESKQSKNPCICAYDGFGYYMYLPSIINRGEIEISKEWAQSLQDKYCDSSYTYQLIPSKKTGKQINIYHMGLSYLKLPSYLIADWIAKNTDYESDGFSWPYFVAHNLNALFFILLGIFFFRNLLRLFTNEIITSIILITIYLGTNFYATSTMQQDLPHLYLFTLNAGFLYYLFRFLRNEKRSYLVIALLLFGLTTAIRPTQAVMGIIPLILFIQKYGRGKKFWKLIVSFPLSSIIVNVPQFIYWQISGGEPIIFNLHTEDIVLTDPNLWQFLFSYRKGWLLYSPVFILAIIGMYFSFKRKDQFFWPVAVFFLLYVWVLSSWECWWYAWSFGSRAMVDIYPMIALFFIAILSAAQKNYQKGLIGIFLLGCTVLNLFQTWQNKFGILDSSRMSKQQYWYIFGKSNFTDFSTGRLLMDRMNPKWINEVEAQKIENQKIITKTIFEIPEPMTAFPHEDLTIGRFSIFKKFPSDETQLTVTYEIVTSNPSQSSLMRLETVSKYNCYSWDNKEISMGYPKGDTIKHTMVFNLPDVRHKRDEMQLYIDNDGSTQIELLSFKIVGKSLVRE